ncbi:helix-turn-helix transcriptional regulator [Streptomyces meridianus]|uniref:AAA family ATPase n=1 Tax=Streptomyces meridianus TaxID=2938945 RepID=A0ABT0X065_9ACTN|nr:LuxR family transcriptional regulator [Streptomyces meridianus]MCM2575949.1 AAA family ATPase [Streptomyces meridianus]
MDSTGPVTAPPAPRLVGRADLLAAAESHLSRDGSIVLTGPSGIGKTSVVDALGAAAAARGELVLRTSGAEADRWLPYAALADLLARIPAAHVAALPGPLRAAVRAVLSGERRDGTGDRALAVRLAWQALLERCAAERPVLLLVDDAQWLDAPSADTLSAAARRFTGSGFRMAAAGRWPDCVTAGDDTGQHHRPVPAVATEIAVPPLGSDDLAELLDEHGIPARVTNKLHADSGGNPLLALALGSDVGPRLPRHGRPAPLPEAARTLIGRRLATLAAEVRETLLIAALAGAPTVELLLRVGQEEAARDIRAAADAGLLVTDGSRIRFTPPTVAALVAEATPAPRRAEVHALLAAFATDSAARLRHRALTSAAPDAELAVALADVAATAHRQGSRAVGAELHLLAADRTPAELDGHRLERLVAAAEVGATAGLPDIVHRAADAVLSVDAGPHYRVRVRMAVIDLAGQGLKDMDEVFAAALNEAETEGDPALLAPLGLRLSWAALIDGRPARSETEADAAAAFARAAGDTATEAMALTVKATAARVMGRTDHRTHLDRALALPQPAVDGWLHMAPRFTAARFAVFDDRLHEARTDLLRMLALVERGSGEEIVQVLRSLSEVSARMGRCRDALDFADRALRISQASAISPGPAWYDAAVAELAGGSVNRAAGYARRGIRASEQEGDAIFLGRHLHTLGQARLRDGDVRGGVEALLRVRELERSQGVSTPLVLRWHADLATGLATLGEPGRAEEVIGEARLAIGDRSRGAAVTAQLDRAEAVVLTSRGQTGAALDRLHEAIGRFEELGQPLELGHCLLVRGGIERRRRRHSAARTAVGEALAVFTRAGARPWVAQADRALALVDGAGCAREAGGEESEHAGPAPLLTAAERQVALLVSQGATNQEVAARMFLSIKTIEASLTRIYRKLGIRSRTRLSSVMRGGAAGVPGGPGNEEICAGANRP